MLNSLPPPDWGTIITLLTMVGGGIAWVNTAWSRAQDRRLAILEKQIELAKLSHADNHAAITAVVRDVEQVKAAVTANKVETDIAAVQATNQPPNRS